MKPEPTIWGVHNDTLTEEIIAGGFISAGWDKLGDLNNIPDGREGFKNELAKHYPERKPLAIAGWAGILTRLRDTMQPGDIVVAPYKPDSTINIGIITGDYYYATNETTHRHRRPVRWEKIGLSRTVFTQPALYEVGSFLTIFRVRKHADEFLAALHTTEHAVDAVTNIVEHAAREETDEENTDEPRASRIERHTRDHVLEALHKNSPTKNSKNSQPTSYVPSVTKHASPSTTKTGELMLSPTATRSVLNPHKSKCNVNTSPAPSVHRMFNNSLAPKGPGTTLSL